MKTFYIFCFLLGYMIVGGERVTWGNTMKQLGMTDRPGRRLSKDETCSLCESLVGQVLSLIQHGTPPEDVKKTILDLCIASNAYTQRVCEGTVEVNFPTVYYIATNRNLTGKGVCAVVMQTKGCQGPEGNDWSVFLPEKPSNTLRRSRRKRRFASPKILQLSDVHLDDHYLPGGNALCNEGVCCRDDQAPPANETAAAGFWGDYRNCDSPWRAVENVLQEPEKAHEAPLHILLTGDLGDHASWQCTRNNTLEDEGRIFATLRETYPGVPVFPALGNHDVCPANVYSASDVPDPSVSTSWLYDAMAKEWETWLPEEALTTVRKGGFYSTSPSPGFRIVSLNTNICRTSNWWLLYYASDPGGQLQWLADTLYESEKNGEAVHVIGHIPPGVRDCQKIWVREYRRIIDRFQDTVRAQIYGHIHEDRLQLIRSNSSGEPIGVILVGGSGTALSGNNPSYRLYSVDAGASWLIRDFETWIYNLTEANLHPSEDPAWRRLYSFNEAFGTSSPSPSEVKTLLQKLALNDTLMDLFYRYSKRDGDPSLRRGCDAKCKRALFCEVSSFGYEEYSECMATETPSPWDASRAGSVPRISIIAVVVCLLNRTLA